MSTIVSIVFPVLTIIIGGACVLLFGVTTTLRATNGDLTARVDFLEGERERLRVESATTIANLEAKVTSCTAELEALRKVVTGEVQLTAITDLLSHHHEQAVSKWTDTFQKWSDTETILKHLDKTLGELLRATREQARVLAANRKGQ
jgi:hypothetical protein